MSQRGRDRVATIMESTLELSYDKLVTLHNMILDRLDHLETAETHKHMLEFTPGCRVSFESKFGRDFDRCDYQIQPQDGQCGDRFASSL